MQTAEYNEAPILTLTKAKHHSADTMLATLGISKTAGIHAPGSELSGSQEHQRVSRRLDVDKMGLFSEAVESAAARIDAEKRIDYIVVAKDLHMGKDGGLCFETEDGYADLPQEYRGLYLLLSRLSPKVFSRSFQTLYRARPYARSVIFNDLMEHYGSRLVRTGKRAGEPVRLKIRTRISDNGIRSVFAVVSESYPTVYDGDHWIRDIATHVAAVSPETRGTVTYNPWTTRVRFDALWNEQGTHACHATGGVFRLVLSGSTRDDAGARYRLWASAMREGGGQYKANHYYAMDSEESLLLGRMHRGKGGVIASEISAAVGNALEVFQTFTSEWGLVAGQPIEGVALFGKTYATVPNALAGLVSSGRIDMGLDKETTLQVLLRTWGNQPGSNAGDLLNALSGSAWNTETVEHAEALETLSAALVSKLAKVDMW